jgi:uncharacterized protein with ParB-like and HNH nuclease domain
MGDINKEPYKPFIDSSLNLQFTAFSLSEILRFGIGFECRNLIFATDENISGVMVKEATDNPYIVDNDGKIQYYQRELVWELIDKRNLIDAMYNYTDIGKFVVVRNSYERLEDLIKKGFKKGLAFHELVDGKQRLNAIVEFMLDKFTDSNNKYYSELDLVHKRKLWSYNKCTIAILENATPDQIKRAFLNVNHTGKPMSREHIEFVKSLNV